jgi:glycosyltransferase involved in cell wall biosynthesis
VRILVLTNLYPNPYQPGRATFNRQQVRALSVVHKLTVIAPISWTDELEGRARVGRRLGPDRRSTCDGITVEHPSYVYPPKVMRGCYGRCFLWSVRAAFRRALVEFKPDLVFAPWAYPDGWAAVELGHKAGLPVVIKLHGSDMNGLAVHPQRLRGTRDALRRADAVVSVSHDLAARTLDLGVEPQRVRVVYDGVDSRVFHPGSTTEARARLGLDAAGPIVLFVGNLLPVKGLDVLVEACVRLKANGTRFTCLLIGQGPQRRSLERQIARDGLGDCVRLLGSVAHDRLGDWYRAADIFVLPSRSEGVPVVLLEAAACGATFVASRVGGIPEIAHLAPSLLVPPDDPAALAKALDDGLSGQIARPQTLVQSRSHADAAAELGRVFSRACKKSFGVDIQTQTAAREPVVPR